MKINIYLSHTGVVLVSTLVMLLPLATLAHGGATSAEEASESNMKLIVSAVVLLALGGFIWFTVFREK